MAEVTFGERLAETRRIKGETIEEVSDQLRIRPSIILAMETSNFDHMPHKGYARNMVSSYARYLGLDSTRITEQFLREFRRFESTSRHSAGSNASRFTAPSRREVTQEDVLLESQRKDGNREMITAAKRNENRSSVFGNDNKRDTDRKFRTQMRQIKNDKDTRQTVASRRPPTRRVDGDATPSRQVRTNDYVGKPPRRSLLSGIFSQVSSRPIMLIIGLVVAFVAILILWAILASTCSNNESTTVPITGAGTSDEGLNEDQASNSLGDIQAQIDEDNEYGAFELVVEVVEYQSWLQIDVDGNTPVGETATAPWSYSFTVNTECRIEAGAPSNVRVYRNGFEVPLENSGGLGVLELKVKQRPIAQNAQNTDAASQE